MLHIASQEVLNMDNLARERAWQKTLLLVYCQPRTMVLRDCSDLRQNELDLMRLLLLFLHAWELHVCNNLVLLSDQWIDCRSDPKALHKLDFEAFDIFTAGCIVAVKHNLDGLAKLEIALGNSHSGGCTIFENYAVPELGGHVQG